MNINILMYKIRCSQSTDFIERYFKKIKIKKEFIECATKISTNIHKLDIASTHQPPSVAAGSILLMANLYELNILGSNVLLRNSGLPSSKDGPAVKSLAIYIPKELLGCLAFELGALDSEYVYFGTASEKNDAGYVEVPGYLPGITYHREK